MRRFLISFACIIFKYLFALRYRVKVTGKKRINKKNLQKSGGILFLPNHVAHVDPIIVILYLWPRFCLRPLVVEYMYRQSFIHGVMKLVRALSIPNFETAMNELKIQKVKEVIEDIGHGLKKKENFLIYPSGRLKHNGKEILGGASSVHAILQNTPQTNVVLVRTTGLWGSSFSRAYENRSPDFKKTAFRNLWMLIKNGLFFMPRRKILIELEPAPKDFPYHASRLDMNRYLENWYNQYPAGGERIDVEPLNLVSYTFWKKQFLDAIIPPKEKKSAENHKFSTRVEKKVYDELSRRYPDVEISPEKDLALDLGMDSLDIAEITAFLSVQFEVEEIHPEDLETVQDILEVAEGRKKTTRKETQEVKFSWPKEIKRIVPELPTGKTIPEAFLRMCDRMKSAPACADDIVGVLSYNRLKISVLLFAKEIKNLPGKHIGILLPASVGAYILILAVLLAKKIPVMLNWTLGPRYLNNMMQMTNTKTVISSWRFLERLGNVEFGYLTKKMLFLEDLKKQITKRKKLIGLWQSKKSASSLLKELDLDKLKEDDIAVVLFTSGTEAVPKGVPLSHKNILENQRSAMQCMTFKGDDVLYGILPPFHSFGLSVAGLFPILGGIKVVYSPDPTDSHTLAEGIHRWKVTLLCSAPSFLRSILNVAKKEQLQSMRFFITGAEKTPQELFDKVNALGKDKKIIEGYGITECSPILTLNRPNLPNRSVGQLVPGVELCTVNPETQTLLPEGQEGEICVRGPNIFKGYIGQQKSPFVTIEGKEWYCTGDMGYRDDRGYIILSGRLKRFAKIGGEMISLGGLEEIITHCLKEQKKESEKKEGPLLAICALEDQTQKSSIILFTTIVLDKNEVNQWLKDAGFSRIVKISQVKKIDSIPLMGAGKIDYRFLQSLIE